MGRFKKKNLDYEDEELFNEFLLERDMTSNSQNHITEKVYRRVLFNFWKPLVNKQFKSKIQVYQLEKRELRILRNLMKNKKMNELFEDNDEDKYYSDATILNYFAILRSFMSFLKDEEIIDVNWVKEIKIPNKTEKSPIHLTSEEIKYFMSKLIEELDSESNRYYQEIVSVLFPIITGTRVSEQSSLNISDINIITGEIRIRGKGNKIRIGHLPLSQNLFKSLWEGFLSEREKYREDCLERYKERISKIDKKSEKTLFKKLEDRIVEIEKEDPLFVGRYGNRISVRSLQKKVEKARKITKIQKKITPHKLRHTFATKLLTSEIGLYDIKVLMGHSKVETTERYLHADNEAISRNLKNKKPFEFNFLE